MIMMYHGTSSSRAVKILRDKTLKKDAPKVYDNESKMPTTNNYIYLTNDFFNAMYYGNKTAVHDKDVEFYVFRFNINKNALKPDNDEINYTIKPFTNKADKFADINNPTLDESLKYALSARIDKDIDFQQVKGEYIKLSSSLPVNLKKGQNILDIINLRENNNTDATKRKKAFVAGLKWSKII